MFIRLGARLLNSSKVSGRYRVPCILVPQLELVQLAHQHRFLIKLGVFAQSRWNQKTTTAFELEVDGITNQ